MPSRVAIAALPGLFLFAQVALAQADPTRPPPGWAPGQPKTAEPAGPQGEVVVSGANRRFVLVDGRAVHPGETYRGAKLLSVGPDGAVWQRDGKREASTMSPNVQKSTRPPASAPRGMANGRNPGEGR